MLGIDFVLSLKGQILREFQSIFKKLVIFLKNMLLKKKCIAMFPTLASIENVKKGSTY